MKKLILSIVILLSLTIYSFKSYDNIKAILPNGQSIIIDINCVEYSNNNQDANGYGTSGGRKYQFVKRTYKNPDGPGTVTVVNAKEVNSFPVGC